MIDAITQRLFCRACLTLGTLGFAATALAAAQPAAPGRYSLHAVTCSQPFRLTFDCSDWHGPTRIVALGGYRMALAADTTGRRLMIARVQQAPDSAGLPRNGSDPATLGLAAIDSIGRALAGQGIQLERLQPLTGGRRIRAWLLEFTGDAYTHLAQFTVLEPTRQARQKP